MDIKTLNPLHQEDIKNPIHPSVYFQSDDYKIVIYRLFDLSEGGLNVVTHPFVIDQNEKIYKYNQDTQNLNILENMEKFYKVLDTLVDSVIKRVDINVSKVEDLEENIYDNPEAIKDWFGLKKELTRMERVLAQAIKTHEKLIKGSNIIQEDSKLFTSFEDIEEHLNRTYRACGINLLKLDSIYSLYTSLANEKMNATIYTLTIISAIFLPLNLLVGFFGMNTEGLYFAGNPNGTLIVSSLLVSLFILFFGYFKFKKHAL